MATTLTALNWVARIVGVVLIILGIFFWTGSAIGLIGLHMALGAIFVLVLWAMAIVAAVGRAPIATVVVGLIWGALILWVGLTQTTMPLGSAHWVIQLIHLLLGGIGIGVAQRLATVAPRTAT
ncbi:MAG TPA: hypothetical protein VIJ12_08955 [Candidatus Baltobacteraceae bacterium]